MQVRDASPEQAKMTYRSDKIALWLACGLQGSLLSSIFEPLYIDTVLVAPPAQSTHKAAHELERALWQRVSPCSTRSLPPTFHLCRADLPPALAPSIDMLPSPLCKSDLSATCAAESLAALSDIEGLGAEAIANGVRQGAAAALPSSRPPLRQSSRCGLTTASKDAAYFVQVASMQARPLPALSRRAT